MIVSHRLRLAPLLTFAGIAMLMASCQSFAGILGTWTYNGCIDDYVTKAKISAATEAVKKACAVLYTTHPQAWAKNFSQCVLDGISVPTSTVDLSKLVHECAIDNPDPKNLSEHGFDCTQECARHEAGYKWAETHNITDVDECLGKQKPFEQGCMQYLKDEQDELDQDRLEERPSDVE